MLFRKEMHRRNVKRQTSQRKPNTYPWSVNLSQFDKIPGFLYVAEISQSGFNPISCFGGFSRLTGFPTRHFFKKDFFDLSVVDSSDLERLREIRNKTTSKTSQINYGIKRKDGEKRLVSENLILLEKDGQTKLIGGVVMPVEKPRSSTVVAHRRSGKFRVVNAIASFASESLNTKKIASMVHDELSRLFVFDNFVLGIIDSEAGKLGPAFVEIARDGRKEIEELSGQLYLDGTVAERVVKERRATLCLYEAKKHSVKPLLDSPFMPKSEACVPLIAGDRLVGIFSLQHRKPTVYKEEDLDLLDSIAASAAFAFENSKFLEDTKRLNKHLLEVNQLKDEFLANTSHELRTPLNSIIGFLTLITEGYYDNDEELRLFTRNALDSSYHLLNVISDLLDISRIEAGEMRLQIERVYIDELLKDIYSSFKVQTDQKGLDLECAAKGFPLFAAADTRKLKQVLLNLAGNAIKFTSRGAITIFVEPKNDYLLFSVKDTGIGIPKEKQKKLFQKFIQIDGSATRQFDGTGLGLVISKHLVEMMGGEITIESEGLGMGTTVHFTIPKWTKEDE